MTLRQKPVLLWMTVWLLVGCQVYDPSLVAEAGPRDAGSAELRKPPERPSDATGDDGEEYVFGLRTVVLDQGGEIWRNLGYDLDNVITRSPDFVSECVPPRGTTPPADGNQGIDNAFGGELFPLVDLAVPDLQDFARMRQDQGSLPVLRIRGWNGEADDSRVDVTITNSIFTIPANPDGSAQEFTVDNFIPRDTEGGLFDLPVWDGTDYGYMRSTTFFDDDPERPLLRDDNAYVSGRSLVAVLPERVEFVFPADGAGLVVLLTDAVMVGRISDDTTSIEDLQVAGRWAILDLLATAEGVGLCRGTDSYAILSNQLDAIADIRSMPGSGGPDVPCDAISLGVGFTGSRMQWGGLTPGPDVENLCTSMGTDGGVPDGGGLDAGVPSDGG